MLTKRAIPNTVEVSYRLAEPRPNHCSLAFSQLLFMVVILSILMKPLMCIVILLVLGPEEPLVTPGDAIASFISVQGSPTLELGLLTQADITEQRSQGKLIFRTLGPRQWVRGVHRTAAVVPEIMYFAVFSFGFVACTTILGQQLESHTPL